MISRKDVKTNREKLLIQLKRVKTEDVVAVFWVVFSFIFVLFMMKTGRVDFETNDDVVMAQIVSGVFKRYSAYNVFNNIFLGLILSTVTQLIPTHNWQTLMDLGLIALSYAMIGALCIKILRKRTIAAITLSLSFVFATFKTLILDINFSKVGALTFLVGFMLTLSSLECEMPTTKSSSFWNRGVRAVGYIMLVFGALIRLDSVKAMLPFVLILICYFGVKYRAALKLENGKTFFDILKTPALSCLLKIAIPLVVVLLVWIINFCVYNTKEWKAYNNYEKACVDIQDFYNFPSYDIYSEEYEAIGLNEHDAAMFSCYVHADNEVYSLETIESIRDIAKEAAKRTINYEYIKKIIKFDMNMIGAETIVLIVVLLMVVSAFIIPKRFLLFDILAGALMFAELSYLYHINRVLERSMILPIIGAFLVIIYLLINNVEQSEYGNKHAENKKYAGNATVMTIIIVCIMTYAFFTRGMCDMGSIKPYVTPDKESLESLNQELKDRPENLYIWDYQSYVDASMQYASPLDAYPRDFMGNSLVLGAWPVEMPLMREIAEPFGNPGNLIRILVENQNAYYVFEQTNPYMTIEAMEEYIRDHYASEAVFTEVKTIGRYTIYRVATDEI